MKNFLASLFFPVLAGVGASLTVFLCVVAQRDSGTGESESSSNFIQDGKAERFGEASLRVIRVRGSAERFILVEGRNGDFIAITPIAAP